jgi:nanoRNase/pAp phosphatase (c-di-AMP/oligoRNAs hydrolase)
MDATEYLRDSARTASGEFHAEIVNPAEVDFMLQAVIAAGAWADQLAETAPFAAAYFDHAVGHRVFSFRSRDGFDVSVLTKNVGAALGFSGGGHAAAAGFRAPLGWEGEGK